MISYHVLLHLKFLEYGVCTFSFLIVTPEHSYLGWGKLAYLFFALIRATHWLCLENVHRLIGVFRISLLSCLHSCFFTLECPSSSPIISLTTKIFQSPDLRLLSFNFLKSEVFIPSMIPQNILVSITHTYCKLLGQGHHDLFMFVFPDLSHDPLQGDMFILLTYRKNLVNVW